MKKKIFFSLAVFLLVFSAASIVKASGNVTGWLWGGNSGIVVPTTSLGWISMNSANCDADADGVSDGIGACPAAGTPISDYGVTIPAGAGNVTGSAWSENLGWVDFEPQNNCVTVAPGAGQYQALSCTDPGGGSGGVSRNATDGLEGWARIVSIAEANALGNSGGWEGWISMSGTATDGSTYGVDINKMDGTGANPTYAWSDELGWIDFSRALVGPVVPVKTLKICDSSCNGGIMIANTLGISSLTILETDPVKNLVACYNSDAGCGIPATDDTSTTAWVDDNNPDNAVSLVGANPASSINLSPNGATSVNKERISATYNGETATFDVTVNAVCQCKACDASDQCNPKTFIGTNCPCSDSCTVDPDCLSPSTGGPNWREVAP